MVDVNILDEIDDLILMILDGKAKPLTTYQLSKKTELSWGTVNVHCYKLKSFDLVDNKYERAKIGSRFKQYWWLKDKE